MTKFLSFVRIVTRFNAPVNSTRDITPVTNISTKLMGLKLYVEFPLKCSAIVLPTGLPGMIVAITKALYVAEISFAHIENIYLNCFQRTCKNNFS